MTATAGTGTPDGGSRGAGRGGIQRGGRDSISSPSRGRGGRGRGRGARSPGRGRGTTSAGYDVVREGGRSNNSGRGNGSGRSGSGARGSGYNDVGGGSVTSPGRSPGGGRNGGRRRHFSARGGSIGRGNGGGGNGRRSSGSMGTDASDDVSAEATKIAKMGDEEVLIAFGPHVRSGNADAITIHQEYLSNGGNQRDFIKSARQFLIEQTQNDKDADAKPESVEAKTDDSTNCSSGSDVKETKTVSKPEIEKSDFPTRKLPSEAEDVSRQNDASHAPNLAPPPGLPSPPCNGNVEKIDKPMKVLTVSDIEDKIPVNPPGMKQAPTTENQPKAANVVSNGIQTNKPPGIEAPTPMPSDEQSTQPESPTSTPSQPGPPPGMPPPYRTPMKDNAADNPPAQSPTPPILPARIPPPADEPKSTPAPATTKPIKVRRTQTRLEEQPGRVFANDVPARSYDATTQNGNGPPSPSSLSVRPRSELTARWVLPLPYLRNRALRRFEEQKAQVQSSISPGSVPPAPQNLTIRDALKSLAVGLFRRGASENGSQSSIVSKEILVSDDGTAGENGRPSQDYPFGIDQRSDSVYGTVPFYAPRTPGNVLFRLYFEDEPHVTLATGPCIHVVPALSDYDTVLRFILSNFKSKKTVGLSSMHSLASVLELFSPPRNGGQHSNNYFDGPGRLAWGCICESRKVVEQAAIAYVKKKKQLEEQVKDEEDDDNTNCEKISNASDPGVNESDGSETNEESNNGEKDKNVTNEAKQKLALETHTNERKWREIQIAYSSVLKSVVSNESIHLLLKRDLVYKIRLEFELWCPLCESFAPNPFATSNDEASTLPGDVSSFPHPVGVQHFRACANSRSAMQSKLLGFVPKLDVVSSLAPKSKKADKKQRSILQEISSAMKDLYVNEYAVSDNIMRRREEVRLKIEHIVSGSGAFPVGTRVAVFGSSANGFGSPNSDLDLCLQVPQSATNFTKEENGVEAMTKLALTFSEVGMEDVNTDRLTARIPIVKFNFPHVENGERIVVECDLSLQNPLACLNTSLLHAYSKVSPNICILASIIKRWAKSRDINNPSKHTLSSYGYVIMLIYYLTYSEPTRDGYVSSPNERNGSSPILPNLQWVDPSWAQNPVDQYREIPFKPRNQYCMVQHPTEPSFLVNSYFYRSGLEGLHRYYHITNSNRSPSLGVLLASFFHFFAFEFDYKKHVVSLNSCHTSPYVEKEVKAEEDGWSLFRQGLAIEDPFELFYDVAHVLKAPNFQHIRKEFALAYTKMVESSNKSSITGKDLIDLICEPADVESN